MQRVTGNESGSSERQVSDEVLKFPPEPDTKLFPEPSPLAYTTSPDTPLVLDMGSYYTRAGWAGQRDPAISFRSLAGKAKNAKGDLVTVVGDQLLCKDITRQSARSPFEKDVLQNLDSAESILDYTMLRLGINTERVLHPVLMTESVCNPNYSRGRMSEVLFECYGVPKVAYAVDALLAYEYNNFSEQLAAAAPLNSPWTGTAASGMIVRVGNSSAHVIPVLKGKAVLEMAYRLNAGGQRISDALNEVLRLRYPQHRQAISASRVTHIKEHLSFVASDYTHTLRKMAEEVTWSDSDTPRALSFVRRIQLPYTEKEVPKQTEEDVQRRVKLRQEQTQRLTEMARVKREEKLNALSTQLMSLIELQAQLQGLKGKEAAPIVEKMAALGVPEVRLVDKALVAMARQLHEVRERHKAKGFQVTTVSARIQELMTVDDKEEDEEDEFPLVSVPDSQLSSEDLAKKRKQVRHCLYFCTRKGSKLSTKALGASRRCSRAHTTRASKRRNERQRS